MIVATLAALLVAQNPADTGSAQGRPCQVAIDHMARAYTRPAGAAGTDYFGGGGIQTHCKDTPSTTLAADSMAYYSALGRLDLVGNVKIRDTTIALDAHFASYFTSDERLEARNNVVLVNRRTGSVLRGPNLRYLRAVAGIRDTVEMYATSRPTVEYRQEGDSSEPYVIVADRLRFKGDDRVWAGGKVTVDRSDFASRSDSLLLDQFQGFGVLVSRAPARPHVEGKGGKTYTLEGTRIELGLTGREVNLIKALGDGQATGDDWTLTADTLHLRVDQRKLQQTFAWGESARPHAVSSLYTIQADSLAIDTPAEVLTESRAFGRAFSTARRDSATVAADVDWITGDTLTTRFVQERDSTGRERSRLNRIQSRGNARALTHHFDERDAAAPPAINYSRGKAIGIALKGDRIDRVVVAGGADGVHLEPRPPASADTTKKP